MSLATDLPTPKRNGSARSIPVFNPSTEEQIGEVTDSDQATVDRAVARAREAFESGVWRKMSGIERQDILWKAAEIMRERMEELATIEARNNGMSVMAGAYIVNIAIEMLSYYAGWATKIHGESGHLNSSGLLGNPQTLHTYTQLEPIGVVGLIVPWNGPIFVAILKLAPALAAGCSAILKPAEETPMSALMLEKIFLEAGVPEGVVQVLTGYGETTGAALTAHPDVDKISFTGSTEVGKLIVHAAAGNLKRLTLELGGKSPLIMFNDADLTKAISGASFGYLAGSGQNCSCTSRIYVQRGIYEEVVDKMAAYAQTLPMGGSEEEGSILGPLISQKQRERVMGIVAEGVSRGATIVTGGKPLDRKGYFYAPTLVTDTTPDMRMIREEIFGPVGMVIPFDEEEEVLKLANDTHYGLAGAIWTENLGRAFRMVNGLRGGQLWVNTTLAADPSVPFGGFKQSGWGGERGYKGLEQFLITKSVYIAHD